MSGDVRWEYTVACPRCAAPKTRACHAPSGNWAHPHRERYDIVSEAWRLGYADGIDALTSRFAGLDADAAYIRRSVRARLTEVTA